MLLNDITNNRLIERCFPDSPMETYFTPTPQSTKQSSTNISIQSQFNQLNQVDQFNEFNQFNQQLLQPLTSQSPLSPYNITTNFAPIVGSKAPFDGFVNAIDTESILRNQVFALQNSDQATYIPSSSSELYHVPLPIQSPIVEPQPFPNLFFENNNHNNAEQWRPNVGNIGRETFNNCTRTQLRNLE